MALLRNKAFLEVPTGDGSTATFEFADGFELTRTTEKNPIMSQRGQYVNLAVDFLPDVNLDDAESADRLRGYRLEGGAGTWERQASFETGKEPRDITWGDGSGGTGPGNVTRLDASGESVHKEDRADIFEFIMAGASTDSRVPGRLHFNQWSDGTYGDEGVYGTPMYVGVETANVETSVTEKPTAIEGSLSMVHIALLPAQVTDTTQTLLDEIQDFG